MKKQHTHILHLASLGVLALTTIVGIPTATASPITPPITPSASTSMVDLYCDCGCDQWPTAAQRMECCDACPEATEDLKLLTECYAKAAKWASCDPAVSRKLSRVFWYDLIINSGDAYLAALQTNQSCTLSH